MVDTLKHVRCKCGFEGISIASRCSQCGREYKIIAEELKGKDVKKGIVINTKPLLAMFLLSVLVYITKLFGYVNGTRTFSLIEDLIYWVFMIGFIIILYLSLGKIGLLEK